MTPKKIMTVFGTRPEAIKMASVVKALEADERFESVVVITAQHRQMLDQVLATFHLTPDYDLDLMTTGQTLPDLTARVLTDLTPLLLQEQPDMVLVHGDTATTFAAALAAYYGKIPVGHVEAGLRTYDKFAPFPEEGNRQLVDVLADVYFAPTAASRDNLLAEGRRQEQIFVTGNTAIDAMQETLAQPFQDELLAELAGRQVILVTMHRRENLGEPMHQVFRALKRVLARYPQAAVVFPVHANPLVRKIVAMELAGVDSVYLIEPLEAAAFQHYLKASFLVVTDSGGVQEEAPSLGVPVLVLRETTERPEGVAAGNLRLVGTGEERVAAAIMELFEDEAAYARMAQAHNPYGDGQASQRILQGLAYVLGVSEELPQDFIPKG